MKQRESHSARWWRRCSLALGAALLLIAATLARHLTESTELVRLRNALLLQSGAADLNWTPGNLPPDFRYEALPPNPVYEQAVVHHDLIVPGDDWATAIRIGQHLLAAGRRGAGRPIQSGMDETYRRILQLGEGYCADYTDAFTGLAHAAGLFARSVAFSFDGFGGDGHVFNEVWDRQAQRWRMIDVFNNFYVVDSDRQPVSGAALRQRLLNDGAGMELVPVEPRTRPGFKYPEKAWEYYRRGLSQWYLWWGNNVFEYDRSRVVRLLSAAPRAVEQLGGIAAGVQPAIRILETESNERQRAQIRSLRARLLAAVWLGLATLVATAGWMLARRAARRSLLSATAKPGEDTPAGSRPGKGRELPTIVVLTALFPSQAQPVAGLFIRERMFRVGQHAPLVVVCPRPWFPFQSLIRWFSPDYRPVHAREEIQDGVLVLFPPFLAVPGFLRWLDGFLMAVCLLPLMRRLRREHQAGILDAHFAYPAGYAATLLGKWLSLPVSVTLRGTESVHLGIPRLRSRVVEAVMRADRVFSVSDALRQLLIRQGAVPEGIHVVGNGVDLEKFRPVDRRMARRELALPPDARILISVGGLVERKGFHRVLDVLPELLGTFPDLHYVIVGGPSPAGDMTGELREQVKRLGLEAHVTFTGALPPERVALALSAADLFVLATRYEGWANVFLEAMACGLPIVTTDVGGNREVVSSPDLGIVVPFGDSGRLVTAIAHALSRDWDRACILAYARDNTWDNRVAVLVEHFREMAKPRRVAAGQSRADGLKEKFH